MIAGEFDFGFAVDLMRKDLALALDEARHNGAQAAARGAGRPVLRRGPGDGRRRWDTSSLIQRLRGSRCAASAVTM